MELLLDIILQIFNIIPFQISLIPPYYAITLFWLNLANLSFLLSASIVEEHSAWSSTDCFRFQTDEELDLAFQ